MANEINLWIKHATICRLNCLTFSAITGYITTLLPSPHLQIFMKPLPCSNWCFLLLLPNPWVTGFNFMILLLFKPTYIIDILRKTLHTFSHLTVNINQSITNICDCARIQSLIFCIYECTQNNPICRFYSTSHYIPSGHWFLKVPRSVPVLISYCHNKVLSTSYIYLHTYVHANKSYYAIIGIVRHNLPQLYVMLASTVCAHYYSQFWYI